ncbi:MAG: YceI family protein [Tabrizicola sp.]|jgi:polyisoprenoid-binding protein YceI|nr:YceI family protein [Tabrizicola sp.]
MLRALLLCFVVAGPVSAQDLGDLGSPPAGTYSMDPAHTRLWFTVDHLGFSRYMALFTKVEATLQFDPDAPESMQVTASVDLASLETHNDDPSYDFNAIVSGPDYLNAPTHPLATFVSTGVEQTGETTARVKGDLTLNGVTKPITLSATYNGGWGHMPLDPGGARAGFSLEGTLLRSDFGITNGIPAPGTKMGVSDEVQIFIETELVNPDAPKL